MLTVNLVLQTGLLRLNVSLPTVYLLNGSGCSDGTKCYFTLYPMGREVPLDAHLPATSLSYFTKNLGLTLVLYAFQYIFFLKIFDKYLSEDFATNFFLQSLFLHKIYCLWVCSHLPAKSETFTMHVQQEKNGPTHKQLKYLKPKL